MEEHILTGWRKMEPRERIFAALAHEVPDRVPRFEIWIDALLAELGQDDQQDAYVNLGQDCIMMPGKLPEASNAWKDGKDEWGRVWKNGMYIGGAVETEMDLCDYSPPIDYADKFFEIGKAREVKKKYPNHCLIYGTHVGPFTAAFMAMGFEPFFLSLTYDPAFAHDLLENRTEWCIALYRKAVSLGAEVLVLGDDVADNRGPMISPTMWREFVFPYHRRIVDELDAPVIWHSDGNIEPLLPMAIEAGFVGIHGLEPMAGMDLGKIKKKYGNDLVLIGNIDVNVLCASDLDTVREEVDRCIEQGAPGGGYMIATCNSIFDGMNPAAVAEMFRYEQATGFY